MLQQDKYNNPHDDIKAELLILIQQEIEKLPAKIKRVFILSYVEGKSNEEIAEELGIHNQSVRNHKTRALRLLRLAITGNNLLFIILAFFYKRF